MGPIFIQLAIILATAFVVSYIIRLLKQPIIIGYIIAGIIISPFVLEAASSEVIRVFSDLGIAFLLFIVGLHLNPKVIKEIGGASLVIGLIQIVITFAIGFGVSFSILQWNLITSAYVGIALAFSSTIIIMKLLSDQRQLESLHGKMSIGILIIQDLVAVAVLMFISASANGIDFRSLAIRAILGGGGLVILVMLVGFYLLPRLTKSVAKSQELLFLFSICWCFIIAALFAFLGFSIEIGALVAGVALSMSPYSTEISSKIRPLRDFFLIIFFIILGLNIKVSNIQASIVAAIILSLIALIIKPLILLTLTAIAGYTKRTNFLVGTTLAQISEFSLIVLALGVSMGHITSEVLTAVTLTGVITITLSTYLIMYSNKIYRTLSPAISIFERKKVKRAKTIKKKYDAILFGYNRIGFSILRSLKKIKKDYLVVDFNPDTIEALNKIKIPALYGDAYDPDLLRDLPLETTQLAVSTIPEFEINTLLIETIRSMNPKTIIIVRAHTIKKALALYRKGANYVLTPHFLGGEYVSRMIKEEKAEHKGYLEEKGKHIKNLKQILEKGQLHTEDEGFHEEEK